MNVIVNVWSISKNIIVTDFEFFLLKDIYMTFQTSESECPEQRIMSHCCGVSQPYCALFLGRLQMHVREWGSLSVQLRRVNETVFLCYGGELKISYNQIRAGDC